DHDVVHCVVVPTAHREVACAVPTADVRRDGGSEAAGSVAEGDPDAHTEQGKRPHVHRDRVQVAVAVEIADGAVLGKHAAGLGKVRGHEPHWVGGVRCGLQVANGLLRPGDRGGC